MSIPPSGRSVPQVAHDLRTEARLRAYALMETAQTEDHEGVRDRLLETQGDAELQDWDDVAQLAATGVVLYDLVHAEDRGMVAYAAADLVHRAEGIDAPSLRAAALGMRAICAGGENDSDALMADAGKAVALAEHDDQPALDRCFTWVLCAAAYTMLNLWELSDELYDRAADLAPECELPRQQAAVAVNRFLIRLEWAAALLEHGDCEPALAELDRADDAALTALATPDLPHLWQRDALACHDLIAFVRLVLHGDPAREEVDDDLARMSRHRAALADGGDVEVLPFLDAFVAFCLFRLDRREEARDRLRGHTQESWSTGAHAFHAWVRAEVMAPTDPDEAALASREYGALVCDLRWSARAGLLAAARSRIAEARLSAEHALLSREVMTDPLTGLDNRRRFDHWLLDVSGDDRPTALLLIDVDQFKDVNDEHGHAVGDDALRRVAQAITANVRAQDAAIRLGGDEFAVILSAPDRTQDRAEADQVLHRAAKGRARAIAAAVSGSAWDQLAPGLRISVSIGLATGWLGEHHPGAAETVYRLADADLYAAKFRRSSQIRV